MTYGERVMPALFLPLSPNPVEVDVTYQKSFRSRSYHYKVKHCVEYTFINGNPMYHFGFSPYKDRRAFIVVARYSNSIFAITQKNYSLIDNFYKYYQNQYEENQIFLVCLDSEESKITFTLGGLSDSITFNKFEHIEEWYAFTDATSVSASKYAHVSVNLGFSEFVNQIPQGYSRWIHGIDGIVNLRKNTCNFRSLIRFPYCSFLLMTIS